MEDKIEMVLSPETEGYYAAVVSHLNAKIANGWKVKEFRKGSVNQDGSSLPTMEVIFEL